METKPQTPASPPSTIFWIRHWPTPMKMTSKLKLTNQFLYNVSNGNCLYRSSWRKTIYWINYQSCEKKQMVCNNAWIFGNPNHTMLLCYCIVCCQTPHPYVAYDHAWRNLWTTSLGYLRAVGAKTGGDQLGWVTVFGWVIGQLGQLSLASLRGRLIEYQLRLG